MSGKLEDPPTQTLTKVSSSSISLLHQVTLSLVTSIASLWALELPVDSFMCSFTSLVKRSQDSVWSPTNEAWKWRVSFITLKVVVWSPSTPVIRPTCSRTESTLPLTSLNSLSKWLLYRKCQQLINMDNPEDTYSIF